MAKGKGTSNKADGFVYIFTNPAFPEYVKIGYSKDWEKRRKQLSDKEAVPYSFRAYAVYEVDQPLVDIYIHRIIDTIDQNLRTIEKDPEGDGRDRKREFFVMSAEKAYTLLECIAKISGTTDKLRKIEPERQEVIDEEDAEEIRETAGTLRPNFSFSCCNIPVGSKIVYIDDTTIQPVVVDEKHIEYNGKTYSMTALVSELRRLGPNSHPLGPYWFTYKGERLTDRRDRIEAEKE